METADIGSDGFYFSDDAVVQSDIQLLASVTPTDAEGPMIKSGLLMEPLSYSFYGKGANVLTFYQEVYHTDRFISAPFVVSYRIEKVENGEAKQVLIGHKRQTPAPVNPLLLQIDISKIPAKMRAVQTGFKTYKDSIARCIITTTGSVRQDLIAYSIFNKLFGKDDNGMYGEASSSKSEQYVNLINPERKLFDKEKQRKETENVVCVYICVCVCVCVCADT